MVMYSCRDKESEEDIENQIENADEIIGQMFCEANNQEIHASIMISRLLTHSLVNLHHLLIEQNEKITDEEISQEIIRSSSLIHSMYLATREMEGPRILH